MTTTGTAGTEFVPEGGADRLLPWLARQLEVIVTPDVYWLECAGRPLSSGRTPPAWLNDPEHIGARWEWHLADGAILTLTVAATALAPDTTTAAHALHALTNLVVSLLDARTNPCAQYQKELRHYQRMLDHLNSSVIGMDLNGYITSWNRGAERLFGYPPEEAIGRHVLFLYADDDDDDLLAEAFLGGSSREMLVRRKKRDGSIFWASISLSLLTDDDGNPSGLLGYLTDATERMQAEEKLRLQAAIFEFSGEAIMVTNARGEIVSVNRAFLRLFGYASDGVIGRDESLIHCQHYEAGFWNAIRAEAAQKGYWIGEIRCGRRNGDTFPAWLSLSAVRNTEGTLTHFVSMISDISERKQAEERIYRLAYFDNLTGLPNRAMLSVLLGQALEEARRDRSHGAVLLVNLDRFKRINDVLGSSAGDELLKQVARRIRAALRGEDVVARCGADEFVVALFDLTRREHALIVAEKILHLLQQPIDLGEDGEITVTASIGISVFPDDGGEVETLLSNAGIALTRLRLDREPDRHYLFFSSEMNERARKRHQLEEDLRRALERDELMLYFQPQFDFPATGEPTMPTAEVLLRWHCAKRGMVPPGEFIPLAEETGLIHLLGDWVLERSCRTLSEWQARGITPVRLAVNISARQFRPSLLQRIGQLLREYRLAPSLLELEITESLLLSDGENVIQLLHNLREMGLRVALDDFGTGYSALSYLRQLPIDTLKIDRCFIKDLPGNPREAAVVVAIIRLACDQGLHIVAEGVETQEQLAFLREQARLGRIGIQFGAEEQDSAAPESAPQGIGIQGFLLARPMPLREFEALLAARSAPHP